MSYVLVYIVIYVLRRCYTVGQKVDVIDVYFFVRFLNYFCNKTICNAKCLLWERVYSFGTWFMSISYFFASVLVFGNWLCQLPTYDDIIKRLINQNGASISVAYFLLPYLSSAQNILKWKKALLSTAVKLYIGIQLQKHILTYMIHIWFIIREHRHTYNTFSAH